MSKPFYAPGVYVCRVTSQSLWMTANQNVQFVLHFLVLGSPDAQKPENYLPVQKQYGRSWYCVLTKNTMERALQDLKVLGFDGKGFGRLDPTAPDCLHLEDQVLDMYCSHELDQDQQLRERWGIARRSSSSATPRQAVTSSKLSELDQLAADSQKGS